MRDFFIFVANFKTPSGFLTVYFKSQEKGVFHALNVAPVNGPEWYTEMVEEQEPINLYDFVIDLFLKKKWLIRVDSISKL
mmetsp:Transcript_55753/g.131633  ORF Transcript_55753/g.131633 Transcript_55753/m.131633 type:complete len:80 (+) Transcript_55753:412-651(+)